MRMYSFRLLAALAVAMLGTVQCSLSPLGGGGTETGNPEGMLACARAVFAEVDSADRWSLAGYLPDGEQQLDPNCLLNQKPQVPLEKSAANAPDTLVIVRDSNIIIITVARYDTVQIIDTLYNNVTVVRNVSVYDTVFPASQSVEKSMVIVERIVPDTIRKIDTVVKSNTQVVPVRDTTYVPLTDSSAVFKIYNQPNADRSFRFADSVIIVLSTIAPKAYNPLVLENNTCFSLSRTALVQGTTVSEKYTDADNDGYLFGPDLSQASGMQFADISRSVSPWGRAEEQELDWAGVAVAKALAPPPVAAEWCLPLVREGGIAVLWVGESAEPERVAKVAERLAAEPADSPAGLLVLRKLGPTPAGFPRRTGVARRRPLA